MILASSTLKNVDIIILSTVAISCKKLTEMRQYS